MDIHFTARQSFRESYPTCLELSLAGALSGGYSSAVARSVNSTYEWAI
jgi:hypothetical protein